MKTVKKGKQFFKDGIRFECQGDGKCCVTRGRYGYVYLSFNDRRRLAAHFHISLEEFTEKYVNKTGGFYELKYTDKDCPFLKDNKCDVYVSRPWQCRTWPFWPENMNSDVWIREVVPSCPGVGKGRLFSASEIEEILEKKRDVAGAVRTSS
jgi:Fe-S-cluster containining protein